MSKVLLKYIPEEALPLIQFWFTEYPFHLRISKSRKTKFGDFRPAMNDKPNRISVNGDLNQYHFLITLTHEIAHVACWEAYKNKVYPHGIEWQHIYSSMLEELIRQVTFPEDVRIALKKHLARPKASSCSDPRLFRVLKKYDNNQHTVFLDEIAEGKLFSLQQRIFIKGEKRRTRIACEELKSKKIYLISAHAEVSLIETTNNATTS